MDRGQLMSINPAIRALIATSLLMLSVTAAAQEPPPLLISVDRYEVTGDNPLDAATTAAAVAPFTGEFDGLDGLRAASDALESELRRRGFVFHRVVLPPQELAGGTVKLEVLTFALGDKRVTGNERLEDNRIIAALPALAPGTTPNLREVSRSLAVANEHPGRRLGLNFTRSPTEPDTLDANVRVTERRPYSVFAGLNNIGTDESGNLRLTLGVEHNDLFWREHIATATFTTSPDNADDVQQYAFNYRAPVYALNGWIQAFYIRSDVDVGNVQSFFDISGAGDFAGVNFKHTLLPIGRYRHSLSVMIQDRRFDTNISNAATGAGIPGLPQGPSRCGSGMECDPVRRRGQSRTAARLARGGQGRRTIRRRTADPG